jgi:hypothetical protein
MRVLRALLGALLWILAGVVGLLGIVLSVTVILLPLGIPLLMLARRMFTRSIALVLPRTVSHPVEETGRSLRKKGRKGRDAVTDVDVKKLGRRARTKAADAGKKAGKQTRRVTKRRRGLSRLLS